MNFTAKTFLLLNINQNIAVKVQYISIYALKSLRKSAILHLKKLFWQNGPTINTLNDNINNDIPVKIANFHYILVNRSVLYNCEIEVENHFLLESLAACHDTKSKVVMYFMVNTAFVDYFNSLTNSLKFPLLLNCTTHEQTLPISLLSFDFDPDLLKSPKL